MLQRVAAEEAFEDLRLEDLDDLQLAAPLELEALQLGHGAIQVEHGVAGVSFSA